MRSLRYETVGIEVVKGAESGLPQRVMRAARCLGEADRLAIELFVKRDVTVRRAAQLMNVNAGTLSRRLTRLSRRVQHPVVLALVDDVATVRPLANSDRAVGLEYFLFGRTAQAIARRNGVSVGYVRSRLTYLRGWEEARRARGWSLGFGNVS